VNPPAGLLLQKLAEFVKLQRSTEILDGRCGAHNGVHQLLALRVKYGDVTEVGAGQGEDDLHWQGDPLQGLIALAKTRLVGEIRRCGQRSCRHQ
jgi:hypothetical protein